MFQLLAKIASYFVAHKFSIQVAALGISGIIIPELANWDHLAKIIVSLITSVILLEKWFRDRKKRKHGNF
jgi:hypothetical protein